MRNLKLTLAYDGTNYCGWQVQPGQPTIQQAVETTLEKITGESIRVAASGRTDSGVHALGQVISFSTSSRLTPHEFLRALNAELPEDIRVHDAAEVAADFHALRSARSKCYRYTIDNGAVRDVFARHVCWYIPVRLDVEAMHRAGQALVGEHDFSSYETTGAARADSVRHVTRLDVVRGKGQLVDKVLLEIEANGFLYNMVRAITGTLVEVGRGAKSESWPAEVLAARDRRRAGMTAPPEGLALLRVDYD
ncbi:MAG: tRNA pseudouridine(38-40) synthase TruA [Planctomycetota bacterium]|nr:MAG: tRNA pseudouridine(38-40) synthase TruA [Planctomycetota bacterium]REK40678.1 MAG: tRNA pseudouridine(38-40) synthase TruA [Planctomycetota bacterium]